CLPSFLLTGTAFVVSVSSQALHPVALLSPLLLRQPLLPHSTRSATGLSPPAIEPYCVVEPGVTRSPFPVQHEMEDTGGIAANVASAITTAMDWRSSPEAKGAAASYLESIKNGDVRLLGSASLFLVRKECSSEIRLHGLKMLQHLVRLRWDELNSSERRTFANAAVDLLSEMANGHEEWALKSQTAALVAEVIRREGLDLWQELLPSLVSLSNKGPIEGELVAILLRWLPEDITVHNEDLEGDRRRVLLRGLTQSLPQILPLLYTLLERHFMGAFSEASRQQFDAAKQHATAVTAALNAVNAYAEWAPVPDLAKYKLIDGCGFLLSSVDFRLHACEFFKFVCQRKRPIDDSTCDFDSAMSNIFQVLMNVSRDFFYKSSSNSAGIDDSEVEFAECLCECLVALGSSFMQCIGGDANMLCQYIKQMLGYFQHFKFVLHFQALQFWLVIMKDLVSKAKVTTPTAEGSSVDKEKRSVAVSIDEDISSAILDVSFQHMLKKTVGVTLTTEPFEIWNDEFDVKVDFSQYRSKLLELIRLIAIHNPVTAASKASHRVESIINSYALPPVPPQGLILLENMQLGLETVVGAVFDGAASVLSTSPEVKFGLQRILEGLLQQLLNLKWSEPVLAELLGGYLVAFGPFLRLFPEAVGCVINKLFELLTSLPLSLEDFSPMSARHARLQICTSFLRIARTSDKSILPHMKGIADTMAHLQGEGRLLRGEHNILGEAFLVMASSAGIQQQQEVLAWLLEPMSKQWTQLEWQNACLSDPLGLIRLCSDTQIMWSIFHNVTFFEKALRRSGVKKGNMNAQNPSPASEASTFQHPMSFHLPWMLPPLLRLLRSIHSLWSQPISQVLPAELRAAMTISHVEQASLLGEGMSKVSKSQLSLSEGSSIEMNKEGFTGSSENDIRNWLKGVRDSGYNILGLSMMVGESFFQCLESSSVVLALMENVQAMDFRHIRQLIHFVLIPLVKSCPPKLWGEWLEKLLYPLFAHCLQVLRFSWSGLLSEGRAKVPDIFSNPSGLELKVEVMEEKLLRDLTREICFLLSVVASPARNSGIPSVEQLANISRTDSSSLKDLDAFALNSMAGFLLSHKTLAFPALQMSKEAFTWTDGDAVSKIASFCGVVVPLTVSTNNVELKEFVAKDLFCAIIQGLALESNAIISSDLISLCREIFVYFADRDPAPRQVLLSLPCIKLDDLLAFEDAISKTSSAKEQKQHMRSLLMLATGNKLKAIVAQKTTNVITNVSARPHSSASKSGPGVEEDDAVGLAAIT
ncbi:hypothetical protein Taro_036230, partial [Colocasia esculenta]|nr:hypothetical protein [Colocasia esculenta]